VSFSCLDCPSLLLALNSFAFFLFLNLHLCRLSRRSLFSCSWSSGVLNRLSSLFFFLVVVESRSFSRLNNYPPETRASFSMTLAVGSLLSYRANVLLHADDHSSNFASVHLLLLVFFAMYVLFVDVYFLSSLFPAMSRSSLPFSLSSDGSRRRLFVYWPGSPFRRQWFDPETSPTRFSPFFFLLCC